MREILIADAAVERGLITPEAGARALEQFWAHRADPEQSFLGQLERSVAVDQAVLQAITDDVDGWLADSTGSAVSELLRDRLAPPPLRSLVPGRYTEYEQVGAGGMGVVYVALDTELNRRVAFKIVRPGGRSGSSTEATTPIEAEVPRPDTPASRAFETLKQRFLQEAWITSGLEHPGVVPVYELGRTPKGVPYYTMRFVRGRRTLKDALDSVRGESLEARLGLLEPFLKLCDTIAYAHSKNVLHRDLKPANVALGEFGEVVVLDWGIAALGDEEPGSNEAGEWQDKLEEHRRATDLLTSTSAIGTPGYMAPEAAFPGRGGATTASDVFSLGSILYEILTGHPPFPIDGKESYFALLHAGEAPRADALDPTVPSDLADLCASSIHADAGARPGSVESFAHSLRAWQRMRVVESEVQLLTCEVEASLADAAGQTGTLRLQQLDRATARLLQIEERRPNSAAARGWRDRADALRASGIREQVRAGTRRAWMRAGVIALAVLAAIGLTVAGVLDARRNELRGALDDIERLADAKQARDRIAEANRLWPLHPSQQEPLRQWVDRSRELVSRRAQHEAALVRIRGRARVPTKAQVGARRTRLQAALDRLEQRASAETERRAAMEGQTHEEAILMRQFIDNELANLAKKRRLTTLQLGEQPPLEFDAAADAWQHQLLEDLLKGIDHLETSLIATIAARLAEVQTLEERSNHAHRDEWMQTIEGIATSPRYRGLRIEPILGLIPLGADPDSGLFEFAHCGSGSIPVRDAETRRLILADDFAIVLVLVPGGTYLRGAQSADPGAPNYDPRAAPREGPVHECTVASFLIGKYECTQAQWVKISGIPTGTYRAGTTRAGRTIVGRNPVETVAWSACRKWLPRYRLVLPTEAQWEYAARGGIAQPRYCGADPAVLARHANFGELSASRGDINRNLGYTLDVDDGHGIPAPVGSYLPNPYGLCDTLGNVSEWCRDVTRFYTAAPVTDPYVEGAGWRAARGGSFITSHEQTRVTGSGRNGGDYRSPLHGLRAAMELP